MGIRATLKGAVIVGLMATIGAGAALAQACTDTEFTSKTGQTYLEAEQAAMVKKDFATAIAKLNSLRTQTLNCYEEGAVIKLSAYIKIENGDRRICLRRSTRATFQRLTPHRHITILRRYTFRKRTSPKPLSI